MIKLHHLETITECVLNKSFLFIYITHIMVNILNIISIFDHFYPHSAQIYFGYTVCEYIYLLIYLSLYIS